MPSIGNLAKLGLDLTGPSIEMVKSVIASAGLVSAAGIGNIYFVDPANGDDNNDGQSPLTAFATLAKGEDTLTTNQNDVLVLIGDNTGATLTASLTWDKSYTHLIGMCAPVGVGNRARVFVTAGDTYTPMVTFSGTGCIIANVSFFHGTASAAAKICCEVTGARNYFYNCRFAGIGSNTQDVANAASLELDGAEENLFENCVIGLDTIARGTASNDEIRVDGSAVRNIFRKCLIYAYIEANTHNLVKVVDATGMDRFLIFEDCIFMSESENNATAMASCFDLPASMVTSYIVLKNCVGIHITAWDANTRGKIYVFNSPTPAAETAGLANCVDGA